MYYKWIGFARIIHLRYNLLIPEFFSDAEKISTSPTYVFPRFHITFWKERHIVEVYATFSKCKCSSPFHRQNGKKKLVTFHWILFLVDDGILLMAYEISPGPKMGSK